LPLDVATVGSVRTRRRIGEAALSLGGLLVLLVVLATFNPRVREQVALHVSPDSATTYTTEGTTVRDLALVAYESVRDVSIEHAPLTMFVLAGTVLLIFMLRT